MAAFLTAPGKSGLDHLQPPALAAALEIAVEHCNVASVVRALSIVTGTVGSGKDELARLYLERSERADRTIVNLENKLQELFKGTEGHVASESEVF